MNKVILVNFIYYFKDKLLTIPSYIFTSNRLDFKLDFDNEIFDNIDINIFQVNNAGRAINSSKIQKSVKVYSSRCSFTIDEFNFNSNLEIKLESNIFDILIKTFYVQSTFLNLLFNFFKILQLQV